MSEVFFEVLQSDANVQGSCSFEENDESSIGKGAIGKVYRGSGRDENGNEIRVAIKVATQPDYNDWIKEEYQVVQALREAAQPHQDVFPIMVLGKTGDERSALVMPLYEQRLMGVVQSHLSKRDFIEAERLAVKVAIEYTYAIEAVHTACQRSCTDRKLSDFFLWKKENSDAFETVVIDWNVMRELTPAFLAAEMRQFGDLWQELFFGVTRRPPLDPFDDSRWQASQSRLVEVSAVEGGLISIGLRLIIAAAVHPEISRRFIDPKTGASSQKLLREALEAWDALLTAEDSAAFDTPLPHLQLTPEEWASVAADLRWRHLRRASGPNASAARQGWNERADALQQVNSTRDVREQILSIIQQGNWTGAAAKVGDLLQKETNAVLRAHLKRWDMLLSLPEDFKKSSRYGRTAEQQFRDHLMTIGKELHIDPQEDQLFVLDKVASSLDYVIYALSDVRPYDVLNTIETEVEFRRRAARYRRSANLGELTLSEQWEFVQNLGYLLGQWNLSLIDDNPKAERSFTRTIFDVDAIIDQTRAAVQESAAQQQAEIDRQVALALNNQVAGAIQGELTRDNGDYQMKHREIVALLDTNQATVNQQIETFQDTLTTSTNKQIEDTQARIDEIKDQAQTLTNTLASHIQFNERLNEHQNELDRLLTNLRALTEQLTGLGRDVNALQTEARQFQEAQSNLPAITEQFVNPTSEKARQVQIAQQALVTSNYPVLVEMWRIWDRRLHDNNYLATYLTKVDKWLSAIPKDGRPNALQKQRLFQLVGELLGAMRACPVDAFTPNVASKWKEQLSALQQEMGRTMAKEAPSEEQWTAWQQEAEAKAAVCRELYGQNSRETGIHTPHQRQSSSRRE